MAAGRRMPFWSGPRIGAEHEPCIAALFCDAIPGKFAAIAGGGCIPVSIVPKPSARRHCSRPRATRHRADGNTALFDHTQGSSQIALVERRKPAWRVRALIGGAASSGAIRTARD